MKRGMNSSEMQRQNRGLVFKTLLDKGSMTRTELAAEIGLQKATITNIINEFYEMGIIAIDGCTAAGRRGENIGLKIDGLYIMSIGITRKDYQIGIFSFNGKQIDYLRYRFDKNEDIHFIVTHLKKDVLGFLGRYGSKNAMGVCLAVPGPFIQRGSGEVELFQVSEFEQLNQVNLRQELEDILGMPLLIKHDAKLAAYAEWRNAQEAKENENVSLIVIRSRGFGIGAGIVINGRIVQGQLGIAGEVGHMGINFNGRRYQNEYAGTFEYCAGTESVVRYMQQRLHEFQDSILNEESTYQDIIDAYQKKDALAVWAIEKMAWMLGYGIANIIYMMNPDCIIIGPDYPELPLFLQKVKEAVSQFVSPYIMDSVSIRFSKLDADSFLLGGYYYSVEKLLNSDRVLEKIRQALDLPSELAGR